MVTMTTALVMLFAIVIIQVIQIIANPLEQSRNETMDLWNLGELIITYSHKYINKLLCKKEQYIIDYLTLPKYYN